MKYFNMYLFFAVANLVSCNKDGAGCFDKAGNITAVPMDVSPFSQIDVNTNVDVQLLPDGPDRVEVEAGENLIEGIRLTVVDNVLTIENLNTCFWSIGYTHPLVRIRNAKLEKIIQHGYGRIYSSDTLRLEELSLQIDGASGGIDLLIDAERIRLVSNALGPITLKGRSVNLKANHAWGDGILYAKELEVKKCTINQSGSNRMELNVLGELNGSLNNLGDVYLFNQKPTNVAVEFTNQGKLIEKF